MSNNIAIKVKDLGKRYRIGRKEEMPDTLAGALMSWLKSPITNYRRLRSLTHFDDNETLSRTSATSAVDESSPSNVIHALRDVSFEVKKGEVLGIIGRNGAGKSTLLKILSRITELSTGRVEIHGRIGSLLEIGTGFHPELSGRDNVYLNGTILGMTKKEIDSRFDEIVDFSGVEKFIDTPVKRYSSGMQLRLAFAVAAHLDPEILLIDEVLAVGDAEFQKKCLGKMSEVANQGRTVLFVSHNLGAISQLCQSCILLREGRIAAHGQVEDAITAYTDVREDYDNGEGSGHKSIRLMGMELLDGASKITHSVSFGFGITLDVRCSYWGFRILVGLQDTEGRRVVTETTDDTGIAGPLKKGSYHVECRFPPLWLLPGMYTGWIKVIAHPSQRETERYTLEIPVMCDGQLTGSEDRILAPRVEWKLLAKDGES